MQCVRRPVRRVRIDAEGTIVSASGSISSIFLSDRDGRFADALASINHPMPLVPQDAFGTTTSVDTFERVATSPVTVGRVTASGKFLTRGRERFLIKGVAYGTFAPNAEGYQFPPQDIVASDFSMMAQAGLNTVRLYTPPPPWLLDEAVQHGLHVMLGINWPSHVAFLDHVERSRQIRRDVAAQVRACAARPGLLMVVVGNEIPGGIVRWHGRRAVERFLRELYDAAKNEAPDTLVTYVNYPPTEFLDLSFTDLLAFNVYLHREPELASYIRRLQNLAGSKPLLLAEQGADSLRQGAYDQAASTAMQVRTAFREGACGTVIFTWTDQWWRNGVQIDDWAFGLVDAERRPKPALLEVTDVLAQAPFSTTERRSWPTVSVVVCAYNAARTIDECLTAIENLNYPASEIIVVNDGSRDATAAIARRHAGVRVVDITNGGLANARNIGLAESRAEIVAYVDADTRVDPYWLMFLVQPFVSRDVAAVGGPNLVPPEDPWFAQCVARAPGAPTHVLIDDCIAEHVPGCNMAFRREALAAMGGFDPRFVRAGDDVDVCWRMQAQGWKIGFSAAALVWHHCRASIGAYWRQQVGYGEGEQWLVNPHPDKFVAGRAWWRGHIYGPLPYQRERANGKMNTGTWGTAAFPSVYHPETGFMAFMPHRVRWQLAAIVLLAEGVLFMSSRDFGWLVAALGIAAFGTTLLGCVKLALQFDLELLPTIGRWGPRASSVVYRSTIALLHLIQPFARATGRLRGKFSSSITTRSTVENVAATRRQPRQLRIAARMMCGRSIARSFWGDESADPQEIRETLRADLQRSGVGRGLTVDSGWIQSRDMSVRIALWGWLDTRVLIEEHGSRRRLVRISTQLRQSSAILVWVVVLATFLACVAAANEPGLRLVGVLLAMIPAAVLATVVCAQIERTATAVEQITLTAMARCGLFPLSATPEN